MMPHLPAVSWRVVLLLAFLVAAGMVLHVPCRAEETRPDLRHLEKYQAELELKLAQAQERKATIERGLRSIDELVKNNVELKGRLLRESEFVSSRVLKAPGTPRRGGKS